MYILGLCIGVLLLKYLEIGPVADLEPGGSVLIPVRISRWPGGLMQTASGYTKRRQMVKADARKAKRSDKQRRTLSAWARASSPARR